MGYGDVAAVLGIDVGHDSTEYLAVRAAVLQLVVADVVVDHLVENRVLYLLLGQIHPGADAQREVVFLYFPILSLSFFVSTNSQKRLRMA